MRGGRDLANHRLDQLTVAEVQAHYGYVRDEKGLLADAVTAATGLGALVRDRFD